MEAVWNGRSDEKNAFPVGWQIFQRVESRILSPKALLEERQDSDDSFVGSLLQMTTSVENLDQARDLVLKWSSELGPEGELAVRLILLPELTRSRLCESGDNIRLASILVLLRATFAIEPAYGREVQPPFGKLCELLQQSEITEARLDEELQSYLTCPLAVPDLWQLCGMSISAKRR
jgi:hypothetical protein